MHTTASPSFDPSSVAEAYLSLVPSHREYKPELIELARIAWDGSWPGNFYREMAHFLGGVPWLADRWIDENTIHALAKPPLPPEADYWSEQASGWKRPPGTWRCQTMFRQFEALALLAGLDGCTAAQAQLESALDLINDGLTSDRSGTAKKVRRRHPLKDALFRLGNPQNSAALAKAFSQLIPKIWVLYPDFGQFLVDAFWPLITGRATTWSVSTDSVDNFGLDKDERPAGETAGNVPALDFQQPELRPFTAEDLVDELSALVQTSEEERVAAASLIPVWHGEETWGFFESVYRISLVATWLRPVLAQHADLSALQTLSQTIHSTKKVFAIRRAKKWRERKGVEPAKASASKALISPSNRNRRVGIFHLRGLLVYGRFHGLSKKNLSADQQLSELICQLQSSAMRALSDAEIACGLHEQYPLETILDRIGNPRSVGELHTTLRALLPEITLADPAAGQLLGGVYLNLLAGEPPEAPKKEVLKKATKTRTSLKTRRIHVPTREQILPGESKEEAQPGVVACRRSEASKPHTTIKEEIQWVHQKIWGSNPLLIRNHIESVNDAEMNLVVQSIERRVLGALDSAQYEVARIGIVAALIALTGRGPGTFAHADSRLNGRHHGNLRPRLLLGEGVFEMPILRPENAFQATKATEHLLEKTVAATRLSLPPRICEWINVLLASNDDLWEWKTEELRTALKQFIASVEEEVGSGVSLARVRNFARARLRESTQDTSKTMLICGDTFGLSTASLYYANVSLQELETSFRRAMWPVFGDVPSSTPSERLETLRVGSQLLVTADTARDLARSPGAAMHASGKLRVKDRRLVPDHNALTNHFICMLMGAGGHRATSALLKLGRFDFDIIQPAALFNDKQCDPMHCSRYTPIADLVAQQVVQYLDHLRGLKREAGDGAPVALRVDQSLRGEAPLFFHLTPEGVPIELEMASWRATLPENWSALPMNWGRTWLASRGREAGIDADHLAIILGHLEATGYPYSRESPLEPAQLSRKVSGPLGALARSAGWVLRNGLNADVTLETVLTEVGALRDWKCEREKQAAQMRQFKIETDQARRSQMRSKREEGEQLAGAILKGAISAEIPAINDLANIGSHHSCENTGSEQHHHRVAMSLDELGDIERTLEEAAGSDMILAMAAHNALYRYLKRAVEQLHWECPIPSPWLAPPTQEPSPFFPGMFRATTQLHILREYFGRIPPRPDRDSSFTDFEWACGIAVMALCIFSFESDALRVRSILAGRMSMSGSSAIDDLLMLETDDRARSVGVRSLAAVALARLRRNHPSEDLPLPEKLDEVLAAQMPQVLAGPVSGLLERLCATIDITNRVELSGLARLANDSKSGCVSMPVARQRQFLEEGWGSVESVSPLSDNEDKKGLIEGRKCKPGEVGKNYRRLRETLYIGTGPKKFRVTGESLSQANIGAFRRPLQRELEALLSEEKLSPLVACIAAYALHMTTHGTSDGTKNPAWSTVYKYITSFGAELVAQGCDIDFHNLDAEEYLDLYQAVIDRKSASSCRQLAARELVGFHTYLHEHHGVDAVDFSDLEGVILAAEHQVDADVVQPQEMARGIEHMWNMAWATTPELPNDPARTRLDRQSLVFALLLRASGGRHNELAALRFKDVLASPEFTVLFVRPSRYRRLKTPAARRIIDVTGWLSRRQRQVISDWIAAETSRLGKSWKSTLPIFGIHDEPKVRVAPDDLRDRSLEALASVTGGRSRVHRVRHLVAGEELSAIWLSGQDWRALRRVRARARRHVVRQHRADVVLPRDIREKTVRLGHRRSSTTVLNYFHMSWMTKSRAYAALHKYETRHAAAVALGISVAGADKILQRKKSTLGREQSFEPISAWIRHAAGDRTATPGNSVVQSPMPPVEESRNPTSARLVSRMLRDIQRGLPFAQAVLTYGFDNQQADLLSKAIYEIEKKTAFRFLPRPNRKGHPRTARAFESARPAEAIIALLDDGSTEERTLVLDLARCHLLWARRSKRDELVWPDRDVDRMVKLLYKAGVAESQIQRFPVADESGFEKLVVLRDVGRKATMNHAIAWALVVVYSTSMLC